MGFQAAKSAPQSIQSLWSEFNSPALEQPDAIKTINSIVVVYFECEFQSGSGFPENTLCVGAKSSPIVTTKTCADSVEGKSVHLSSLLAKVRP